MGDLIKILLTSGLTLHTKIHTCPGRSMTFEAQPVAIGQLNQLVQAPSSVAVRREKTLGVASEGLIEMERATRLERATSTLARWCSTN